MADPPELGPLEERIGYVFHDRDLLKRALTHASATADRGHPRRESNERLEFLGDRVLGLVVAQMLFAAFPNSQEGELSRRLASLVRKETCAQVASGWAVGPLIRLAAGEARTGGRSNTTILSDVCEAILGAVFLDAPDGYAAAREVVERAFGPLLHGTGRAMRDAKSALQEWALARGRPVPVYETLSREGPDHAPSFRIGVRIGEVREGEGQGRSKREAEQAAAAAVLARQGVNADDG